MPIIVFKRKGITREEEVALERHDNFPKNEPILVGEDKSLIGVISSTEVRKRVQQSEKQPMRPCMGIAGLVTQSIYSFIVNNRLYMENHPLKAATAPTTESIK